MIEFSKHIEVLLLTNNCVIVPKLGGFITHNIPSRYVTEEGRFLPPFRKVGFNSQLSINDGLLVQSYMQAYDTSFPEANRIVNTKVSEIIDILHRNGSMNLPGIGTLSMNIDGKIEFNSVDNGILAPRFYGLGSYEIKTLEQINAEKQAEMAEDVTSNIEVKTNEARTITLRIRPQVIRNIAAACLMIILFFTMSVPVENTYVEKQEAASIEINGMFNNIKETSFITSVPKEYQEKNVRTITHKAAKPVVTQKEPAANEAKTLSGRYSIVLASAITKKNADIFVEKLHKAGYKNAIVYNNGKMNRVLYDSFDSESDAQAKLNSLRDDASFKDAWVYFVK